MGMAPKRVDMERFLDIPHDYLCDPPSKTKTKWTRGLYKHFSANSPFGPLEHAGEETNIGYPKLPIEYAPAAKVHDPTKDKPWQPLGLGANFQAHVEGHNLLYEQRKMEALERNAAYYLAGFSSAEIAAAEKIRKAIEQPLEPKWRIMQWINRMPQECQVFVSKWVEETEDVDEYAFCRVPKYLTESHPIGIFDTNEVTLYAERERKKEFERLRSEGLSAAEIDSLQMEIYKVPSEVCEQRAEEARQALIECGKILPDQPKAPSPPATQKRKRSSKSKASSSKRKPTSPSTVPSAKRKRSSDSEASSSKRQRTSPSTSSPSQESTKVPNSGSRRSGRARQPTEKAAGTKVDSPPPKSTPDRHAQDPGPSNSPPPAGDNDSAAMPPPADAVRTDKLTKVTFTCGKREIRVAHLRI